MSSLTPIYRLPYLDGTDGGKAIKTVSKSLAETLEATLKNRVPTPIGSDLASLLTRLAAVEGKVPTVRNAVYTATRTGIADGAIPLATIGTLSRQSSSVNDTFVTAGNSSLTLKDPGVYAITWKAEMKNASGANSPATGRSFIELAPSSGPGVRIPIGNGEDVATLIVSNFVVGTSPITITLQIYKTTGSATTLTSAINVTKMI